MEQFFAARKACVEAYELHRVAYDEDMVSSLPYKGPRRGKKYSAHLQRRKLAKLVLRDAYERYCAASDAMDEATKAWDGYIEWENARRELDK